MRQKVILMSYRQADSQIIIIIIIYLLIKHLKAVAITKHMKKALGETQTLRARWL